MLWKEVAYFRLWRLSCCREMYVDVLIVDLLHLLPGLLVSTSCQCWVVKTTDFCGTICTGFYLGSRLILSPTLLNPILIHFGSSTCWEWMNSRMNSCIDSWTKSMPMRLGLGYFSRNIGLCSVGWNEPPAVMHWWMAKFDGNKLTQNSGLLYIDSTIILTIFTKFMTNLIVFFQIIRD